MCIRDSDSYAAVLRGSDEGEVVKPGNSSDSELFRRITLPPGDEDIMPSGDSLPLSPAEISVLESWISAGAPPIAAFEAARQGCLLYTSRCV